MKLSIKTEDAKKFLGILKEKEEVLSEVHKKLNKSSNFSESDEEKRKWYVEDNRLGLDDGNGDKNGLHLIVRAESDDSNRLVFSFENQIVTDESEAVRLFQDLTYFLISGYIKDVEFFSVTLKEQ